MARLSCNNFWRLIQELSRLKNRNYFSSVELGNLKKNRFRKSQYEAHGWDWYDCFESFYHQGKLLRYKLHNRVWIVSNNKRCKKAFLNKFSGAKRKDF